MAFDAQGYLNQYADVAAAAKAAGGDPLAYAQHHYDTYGKNEGRLADFGQYVPMDYSKLAPPVASPPPPAVAGSSVGGSGPAVGPAPTLVGGVAYYPGSPTPAPPPPTTMTGSTAPYKVPSQGIINSAISASSNLGSGAQTATGGFNGYTGTGTKSDLASPVATIGGITGSPGTGTTPATGIIANAISGAQTALQGANGQAPITASTYPQMVASDGTPINATPEQKAAAAAWAATQPASSYENGSAQFFKDAAAQGYTADQIAAIWGYNVSDVVKSAAAAGVTFGAGGQSGSSGTTTPGGMVAAPAPTSTATTNGIQPWNVTANQTVAGQVAALTDPNNPLNVQARTQADQEMNRRGIINSSLAEGAAQAAVLGQAVNIGGADAATYGKAASYNADQVNQMGTQNRALSSSERIAALQAATSKYGTDAQVASNKYSTDTQAQISSANNASQQLIAKMNNDQQAAATQIQQANQVLINTNNQASTAYNNAMQFITQINQSDKMDANSKTQAAAQVYQQLQSQLRTIGAVSGLNVSGQVNLQNAPGFDAQGNYIGFNPDGTTVGSTPAPAPAAAPAAPVVDHF